MFNQIRDIGNGRTVVTYLIMLCSLGITIATILFPNLQNVYGVYDNNISFLQWFTISFTHGFDTLSGLVHLGVNLAFFAIIGNFMEKVLGSMRYLLICFASIAFLGILGNIFELRDQGLHGITWAFAPLLVYTLNEGRRIKTRTMYEEHYKLLRTILIVMFSIIPITGIFVQFFVNPEISLYKAIFQGLTVYVGSIGLGIILLPFHRKLIKENLKFFNRKKRLRNDPNNRSAWYISVVIPLFLLVVFILGN